MANRKDIVTPWGGLSTEHEVKQLMAAFPELKPGDLISHAEIEKTIDCAWKTSRYRTVVHAWSRRLLHEKNIKLAADPGKGLQVLSGPERVRHVVSQHRRAGRQVGRAMRELSLVDREELTEIDQVRHDHARKALAQSLEVMIGNQKQLAADYRTPPALPRAATKG